MGSWCLWKLLHVTSCGCLARGITPASRPGQALHWRIQEFMDPSRTLKTHLSPEQEACHWSLAHTTWLCVCVCVSERVPAKRERQREAHTLPKKEHWHKTQACTFQRKVPKHDLEILINLNNDIIKRRNPYCYKIHLTFYLHLLWDSDVTQVRLQKTMALCYLKEKRWIHFEQTICIR